MSRCAFDNRSCDPFFTDGKEIEAPAYAHDRTALQRLWEVSEQLTQLAATKGVTPINDPNL
jgi:hypothetical protein